MMVNSESNRSKVCFRVGCLVIDRLLPRFFVLHKSSLKYFGCLEMSCSVFGDSFARSCHFETLHKPKGDVTATNVDFSLRQSACGLLFNLRRQRRKLNKNVFKGNSSLCYKKQEEEEEGEGGDEHKDEIKPQRQRGGREGTKARTW